MAAETNWADAFNNVINKADDSFKTFTDAETQKQRNELLARNPSNLNLGLNSSGVPGSAPESMFSTRNILLYAGIAVAGFMLYKFAKKNKYI